MAQGEEVLVLHKESGAWLGARTALAVLIVLPAMPFVLPLCASPVVAQAVALSDPAFSSVYQRTRLILKDGSFQVVLSYKVDGSVLSYRSAERNGELEDIPLRLVDMQATVAWYREHVDPSTKNVAERPVLSPELTKEEADRGALTPEIAPSLRLPQELSLLALDVFDYTPELVPLSQHGTDLNKQTAHGVLKQAINPASLPHRILELPKPHAEVQIHTVNPVFYVRVGDDLAEGGGGFVVDTHSTGSGRETPSGGGKGNTYVIERLDARQDSRLVNSFRIALLNRRRQPEVIETREQDLPGDHWLKLTPTEPLEPGEYALIEIVSDHEVNLNVWAFGINPSASENLEVLRPDPRGPAALKSRKP